MKYSMLFVLLFSANLYSMEASPLGETVLERAIRTNDHVALTRSTCAYRWLYNLCGYQSYDLGCLLKNSIINGADLATARILLEAGAPVIERLTNTEGRVLCWSSSMHEAARLNNLPLLSLLIQFGGKSCINAEEAWTSETPLHVAAKYGSKEAAQYLLDRGADPAITMGERSQLATEAGILKRYQSVRREVYNKTRTAYEVALAHEHPEVAALLPKPIKKKTD